MSKQKPYDMRSTAREAGAAEAVMLAARVTVPGKAALALAALLALWALLVLPAAASTSAQSAVVLVVKIVNGTPGGVQPSLLPVSVSLIQNGQPTLVRDGQTDASGNYITNDLAGPADASYVISTTYKGVPYKTQPTQVSSLPVQLPVYETTDDDSRIRIGNAGVVILEVDPKSQILRFLETATLSNSGDRTFLPTTTGVRGPMGLLRFGLPAGAGNLVVGEGLANSTVIQVNTGFATDLPVPPGSTNVSFAYEMAYGALSAGGYAQVARNIVYPIDHLQVLAVQGDYRLQSSLLADQGLVTVGNHAYQQFSAANLPAHSEVSFELRDLPLIQPILRPGNPWLQLLVGILALAAVLVPVVYTRKSKLRITSYESGQSGSTRSLPLVEAEQPAARGSRTAPVRRIASRPPSGTGGEPRL